MLGQLDCGLSLFDIKYLSGRFLSLTHNVGGSSKKELMFAESWDSSVSAGDSEVQGVRRTEDVVAVVVGFLHDVHLDALVVRGG